MATGFSGSAQVRNPPQFAALYNGPGKEWERINSQALVGKFSSTTLSSRALSVLVSQTTTASVATVAAAVAPTEARGPRHVRTVGIAQGTSRSAMMANAGMQATHESRLMRKPMTVQATISKNLNGSRECLQPRAKNAAETSSTRTKCDGSRKFSACSSMIRL